MSDALEFRKGFWHQKTRLPGLSYGIVCVILGLAVLVELRLVREMDRQMDGRTTDDDTFMEYPCCKPDLDIAQATQHKECPVYKDIALLIRVLWHRPLFYICPHDGCWS